MSGRVVHFEIPADDLGRAQAFYREVFGWQVQPMEGMDYTAVTTSPVDEQGMPTEPGAINGGMMQREDPVSTPVVTVDVDDVDAALATIESLGGATVLPKQAIGDMGFAAYFRDTEGNLMGLWQSVAEA